MVRVLPFVVSLLAAYANAQQTCPGVESIYTSIPVGAFISASISWKQLYDNTVSFEIQSMWRRKHQWPCSLKTGFSGPDGYPGLGDQLRVMGLSAIDNTSPYPRIITPGKIGAFFSTGDGKDYELPLKVMSYSIEEDWISCISVVVHTYPAPYQTLKEIYPASYVAVPGQSDLAQPYTIIPWRATLAGCCRRWAAQTTSLNFAVGADVDLSNQISSTRIITMPYLSITPTKRTISICALSLTGQMGMWQKNGGTLNWPSDDNIPAQFEWSVLDASLPVSIVGGAQSSCVSLEIDPLGVSDGEYIRLRNKLGNAVAEAEMAIVVKADTEVPPTPVPSSSSPILDSRMSCSAASSCIKSLNLGKYYSWSNLKWTTGTWSSPLELRYTVATASSQSPLVSTSQSTVVYSSTKAGEDHAYLPRGAWLSPYSNAGAYITDLAVTYSSSTNNTDPRADLPISYRQRDYYDQGNPLPSVWNLIPKSNFNSRFGGAQVNLFAQRMTLQVAAGISDPKVMAAITSIKLANESQVSDYLYEGYIKLDRNLLEQSNRGSLFIMYKKGSGPPVLDISTTPVSGYVNENASIYSNGIAQTTVILYVKYSDETSIERAIMWRPCTLQDEPIVICLATVVSATGFGDQQFCIYLDVVPLRPPSLTPNIPGPYTAIMGNLTEIAISIIRMDEPVSGLDSEPTIHFSTSQGSLPEFRMQGALTSSTPAVLQLVGLDKTTLGLSQVLGSGDSVVYNSYISYLQWIPSPYQGGWAGEICVDVCLDAGSCPAIPNDFRPVCSSLCLPIQVQRCKWALQAEDSFIEIAPRFQTNWLQLWYLNPPFQHPDYSGITTQAGSVKVINIGRVYKVQMGDTITSILQRFGASLESVINLNADLTNSSILAKKGELTMQEICIIPDSCAMLAQ